MRADKYGTSAEQRRFAQGWMAPATRPMCGNCRHVEAYFLRPDSLSETERFRCTRGDFATGKQALCTEWEAR